MRQEKYWASRVPLPLALLFVLNVFLIVAFQLLFLYRYPAQPDATALARYDTVYDGCTIAGSDSVSGLNASLVETADGQTHLVVTKAHDVAYGRGKILYAEPVEEPQSGEQAVFVKNGIHTSEIRIAPVPGGTSVSIQYGYSGGLKEITALYMLLAAVLEALELLVIHFIRKNLT